MQYGVTSPNKVKRFMHDTQRRGQRVYITVGRICDAAITIPLLVIEHDYHSSFPTSRLHIVARIETMIKHWDTLSTFEKDANS